jgi:hypothetical protein
MNADMKKAIGVLKKADNSSGTSYAPPVTSDDESVPEYDKELMHDPERALQGAQHHWNTAENIHEKILSGSIPAEKGFDRFLHHHDVANHLYNAASVPGYAKSHTADVINQHHYDTANKLRKTS